MHGLYDGRSRASAHNYQVGQIAVVHLAESFRTVVICPVGFIRPEFSGCLQTVFGEIGRDYPVGAESPGQLRYFHLEPERPGQPIEKLTLESYDNHLAPTFLSLTAELPGAPLGEQLVAGLTRLRELLASHEGRPYSPCRHPEGAIGGATLLTALFDLGARTMRVYKNQPCQELYHDYPLAGVLA